MHGAQIFSYFKMAELFKDETGVYKVRYLGVDGRKHTSTTRATDRRVAAKVLGRSKITELELAAKANALTADSLTKIMAGRKVSVDNAVEGWREWAESKHAVNTFNTYSTMVNQMVSEFQLNGQPFNRLTFQEINAFVNDADESVKFSTRKVRLAAISSLMNYASAQGYCIGNHARLVTVNRRALTHAQNEPEARRPFTFEEYERAYRRLDGFWKAAIAIGYWTGMRISDVATLEWTQITAKEIIAWTRKTGQRIALPLMDPMIGGGVLMPVIIDLMMGRRRSPRFCFPKQAYYIMEGGTGLSRDFTSLLRGFGLYDLSFHCLRHSFAHRLQKDGRSLEEIGRLLGHSNTDTTRVYTGDK